MTWTNAADRIVSAPPRSEEPAADVDRPLTTPDISLLASPHIPAGYRRAVAIIQNGAKGPRPVEGAV